MNKIMLIFNNNSGVTITLRKKEIDPVGIEVEPVESPEETGFLNELKRISENKKNHENMSFSEEENYYKAFMDMF